MIACNFCGACTHPSTGCVYGPNTIACRECVRTFWSWALRHMNGRPKQRKGPPPALSFYEHAAMHIAKR